LFEDHVPDRVAAGPLLQNDGGIPDSSGEGVARLRTQNGRQVMQHKLFFFLFINDCLVSFQREKGGSRVRDILGHILYY
jgi:hypothetical protein